MAENGISWSEEALTEAQRKRAQRRLIYTASASVLWNTTTVTAIGPLFLMTLGGGAIAVGFLATLNYAAWLGQIIGLKLVPRYGKVGLAFHGGQLTLLPACGLVLLALLGAPGPVCLGLALAGYGLVVFVRTTSMTGWWPLLQDATVGDAKGTFFTRLRMPMRMLEMLIPLGVGWYMGKTPDLARFALPFAVGVAALVMMSLFIRGVPERRIAPPDTSLLLRIRLAARANGVRQYMIFVLLYSVILGFVTPFWLVLLKQQRGLSAGFLVWLVTAQAVGHLCGLPLWGRMVDRHGGRSALSLTLPAVAVLGLAWLFAPAGGLALSIWALAFYAIYGFLEGGYMMGRTWTMVSVVPAVYQSDAFTVVNLCNFSAPAVGTLLGGFAFDALAKCGWSLGGVSAPVLYLAIVQFAVLSTWWAKHRLGEVIPQTSARELIASVWRRFVPRPDAEE